MKNFSLSDAERYIKRCMKNELSINKALVIGYLITGVFSFDAYGVGKKNIVVNEKDNGKILKPEDISTIGKDGMTIGDKSVILSEGERAGIQGRRVNLMENDPERRFSEVAYGYTGALKITNAGNNPENKFKTTIESVLIGHRSVAYTPPGSAPKNLVAIGHKAAATTNAVALGDNTAAVGDGTIAIGKDTYVGQGKSIAIGYKSYSYHKGTVGIGPFNYIAGNYGVAIGYNSVLEVENAVAIGYNARVAASKPRSVAIGSDSLTTADLSTAGHDFNTGSASIKTDSTWKPTHGEFAIGNAATVTRRITGVAAGEKDTDAVNVAQLKNAIETVNKDGGTAKPVEVDVNVEKKAGASDALSVEEDANTKHHFKIDLNEETLTNNLSKEADLAAPKNKLVTDKQVHAYVEDRSIIFQGNQAKDKFIFKLSELNNSKKNVLHLESETVITITPLEDKSGFKFDVKDGGITSTHLANNAVTTEKINNQSVTEDKLENTLKNKINNAANTDLSNITTTGKNKIKEEAKKAINVVGTKNEITVTSSDTNDKKTFTVGLDTKTKEDIKKGVDADTAVKTKGIKFTADDSKETTKILGDTLNIAGDNQNIKTVIENNGVKVKLNSTLTGIEKIGKDNDNSLSFSDGKADNKTASVKVGGTELTLKKVKEKVKEAAPNGGQPTETDKSFIKISNVATPTEDFDAANKKYVDDSVKSLTDKFGNSKLKYKASKITGTISGKQEEVTLDSGLDFKSTDNITTEVAADGVVKHKLNSALTKISSIENEKDKSKIDLADDGIKLSTGKDKVVTVKDNAITGVKTLGEDSDNNISFKKAKDGNPTTAKIKVDGKELTITKDNEKLKISGLADGEISDNSAEVINGKQLNELAATHLGLTVKNKTGFNAPTFKALKDEKGTDGTVAKTFKAAIDTNIEAINRGFKVAGNQIKDDKYKDKTQYLGSTTSIKAGDFTEKNQDGTVTTTKAKEYKGKNLRTEYSYDDKTGNGTVIIGMTENPEFKSVEFNNGETDAKIAKISTDKDGNIIFETQKANNTADGTKVTIKGDEISGVSKIGTDKSNISFDNTVGSDKVTKLTVDGNTVDFKKSTTKDEIDKVVISNVATPTADYDAANKKYVDDTLTNSANTLKGLGMKFKGDDDQEIKRSLGETLNIKGKSDAQLKAPTKAEELSNGNISVLKNGSNDTLTIGLSKKLNDLSSAKFDGTSTLGDSQSEKVSTVIDGEGIKAKEEKGQDANPKKGHYLYNKALLSEGDNSTETTAKGTTVRDVQNKKITSVQADGTTIKELKDDGSAKDDGKSAEYKLDLITLENKDPKNKRKTEINDSSVTISGDTNKEKVTLDKDGIAFTKEDNSEGIKINAKDSEISGTKSLGLDKDNNISFNNEDKDKNKTTKISVDGNSIELKKSKEKDETDKVVISNVATPQEDYDAANKKYVDNEIKEKTDEISNNVPVVYTDKDGNKIIKKGDKFYKTDDKGQATKVEVPKDKVFVSLKEKTQLKNLKSGLGIDDIKTHSDSEKQGKNIEKVKDLTEGKLDTELNNAANTGDLKALALSGMDFVGNDNKTVHRNLGQTLSIKGKGTDANNFLGADGNINVTKENDGLVVELAKKLQNLEEAVFTKINTDSSKVSSKVDGEGTEIKELDKDGNPKQDGKSAEYKLDGATIKNEKGSAVLSPTSLTFNDNDGNSKVKIDGATASMSVGKVNVDGEKATITGLADLNENSHGSSATNKNYVDSKLGNLEEKVTGEIGSASALNAALAALKPLSYDPLRKSQFSAGMGMYKGQTAFALGLNHYTSENTLINGGVSFASGSNVNNRREIMLNLGITHKFGSKKDIESLPTQYQEGPITALYVLQQELQKVIAENSKLKTTVQTQAKENAEVIQKLEKQEKENAELKARMDKQEEQIQMLLERIK